MQPVSRHLGGIQERLQNAVQEHRNVIIDLFVQYVKRFFLQPCHLLDIRSSLTKADRECVRINVKELSVTYNSKYRSQMAPKENLLLDEQCSQITFKFARATHARTEHGAF
uniref:Uncharacterized protein n=1 Tax=Physcomitrium patens TaxID=3218 RepID=A0A2K1JHJ9_PHYPA|nr:hypothetical protein PHYPA_018169 [Physcomitrium patens]